MDIEEIIINLKVLEKLDKNQKLITRQSYLNIEPQSIVPEFVRRWNRQDNRNETLKKINEIVNNAITFLNDKNITERQNYDLIYYLENSLIGVCNLKQTYSTCSQTCARLDVLTDKIKNILKIHKKDDLAETQKMIDNKNNSETYENNIIGDNYSIENNNIRNSNDSYDSKQQEYINNNHKDKIL